MISGVKKEVELILVMTFAFRLQSECPTEQLVGEPVVFPADQHTSVAKGPHHDH